MDLTLPSSLGDYEPHLSTQLEPAPNNPQLERPVVKAGDLCVGCIVWLPAKTSEKKSIKCCRKDCCNNSELDDTGYNHPVVVLKIRQRKNSTVRGDLILYVASITTFSDIPLSTYLAKRSRTPYFQQSMPIYHCETLSPLDRVENTPSFLLRLQKGSLRKQSYIRLEHVYKIPSHQLRTYGLRSCRAYKMRLAPTSYTLLMEEMGLRNEPYEDTMTLYETAKMRLEALARMGTPREDRIRESHAYFSLPTPTGNGPQTNPLSTPLERMPQSRNTMSYISVPGGGRSRSSSKASTMSRSAILNYGAINTNLKPDGTAASTLPSSAIASNATTNGVGNGNTSASTSFNPNATLSAGGANSALSPIPYYLPPPTPHTAHYHSFKEFKDNDWKWLIAKVVAGLMVLGTPLVFWWTKWSLSHG